MSTKEQVLPRWDMTPFFPSLESEAFRHAQEALEQEVDELTQLFDAYGVRAWEGEANPPVDQFEQVLTAWNRVIGEFSFLNSYVFSFVSTNSEDETAQKSQSELRNVAVRLTQLGTRLEAWLGCFHLDELFARSELAREHAYQIEKARIGAAHQMGETEERLAADLQVTGGDAWARLYNSVTSRLQVTVSLPDGTQTLPMSRVRHLAEHPDAAVREAAYKAELAAWQEAAVPLAAALNNIKGEVNTLTKNRGWDDPLDEALFAANIDHSTLDAMHEAAKRSFPDFRRYLQAKARALGKEKLPWFDMFAPVGNHHRTWTFDDARTFICDYFGQYSPFMADFAARAFDERWIDAEPRPGKRDGAFCMEVKPGISRILMNFSGSFSDISTLAHELGHAYHNVCLEQRTPMQRSTPMTLAETASIFCEQLVIDAALQKAEADEKIVILEESLRSATQVVVDIHSRFLFERRVFAQRKRRELSISELNELMLEAQKETYGNGLDEDVLHPYMWAVKGHYYSVGRSFYNFPYTFGLLFGLGLFARYRHDPAAFRDGYDELLGSTGLHDAATLAARFDIDIRTPDFWERSLRILKDRIEAFRLLVEGEN